MLTTLEERGNFITLANTTELAVDAIALVLGDNESTTKNVMGVKQTREVIAETVAARINNNLNNGGA